MLEEKLNSLPEKPGVYLMKDDQDNIIYIGKAVSLKNRVRSYFSSQHLNSPKTRVLVSHIRDLEYILTDSEVEALILESNLIKKHKPKYNIRLTDDKDYPFLRLTVQEAFPRLEIARTVRKDGSRYFGPYTDTQAVNETLKLLKQVFPLRSCKQKTFDRQVRPCLNAHIRRCAAPCRGLIGQKDYGKMISEVILFLEGKQEDLSKLLHKRMAEAAEALEFEKAAEIRDQLLAIDKVIAKQKIVSDYLIDLDAVHYARSVKETCVQVFFVRNGKLLGRDHFFLAGAEGTEAKEILSAFVKQYYSQAEYVPGEILLPEKLEDAAVLEAYLTAKRGARVHLKLPKQGDKRDLLELAGKNALESLQHRVDTLAQKNSHNLQALDEITAALGLDKKPQRLECYDISHIQGAETVASMVVFEAGKADISQYRRFKIKTVEGPDDFASMAEVLYRRFSRAQGGDEKFGKLPDLVVIDGGKGQLSAARSIMRLLGYGNIMAVGLAKENEWLFLEDRPEPVILSRHSAGLQLLQRIRDESHRYALAYHRLLRGKRNLSSALDEIAGIGPKRKAALLRHFGLSLKKISNAAVEELAGVDGISREVAQRVWEAFHPPEL